MNRKQLSSYWEVSMVKKIKESEAIKIYVLKDRSRGRVWIVESPDSVKCKKEYARKKWCFSPGALNKRIQELTKAKLSLK